SEIQWGTSVSRDPPLNAREIPRFFAVTTLVLSLGLAAALSSQSPPSSSLAVLSREGRRAIPITMVADQEFVALDDLTTLFQLAGREEAPATTTVSNKGKPIVPPADRAPGWVAARWVSRRAPPSRTTRRWLVPEEFISRALALVYDAKLDLRKPSRLLI